MAGLDFKIIELNRISPSKYTALKKCPLKVLLANSLDTPLLPYSPKNHLGNVIHKCIQLISQNKIKNAVEFDKSWDELIKTEEEKLKDAGFEFYLPLRINVEGYTIKKLQTKELIRRQPKPLSYKTSTLISFKILTEEWLESMDGYIGGSVDLIFKSEQLTKLSDFKTGKIFEEEGEIKKDYEDQLKLYAYLYKEKYKTYPNKLSIIDLEKEEYFIDFTPEECEQLANESKSFLFKINQQIKAGNLNKLANPQIENCINCLYRPACNFYWNFQIELPDSSFFDINGKLVKIKKFINGDINATIIIDGKVIKVYHIKDSLENFLFANLNKEIAFFNIRRIGERKYGAIKTTKIYEFHE